MTNEKEWSEAVADRIRTEGQLEEFDGISVRVGTTAKLPYARKVLEPVEKESSQRRVAGHQTDLLLYDQLDSSWWVPRVVIECILGEVTADDALTFSAKAAKHRNVHSYLRCGVLVSSKNLFPVPASRMLRHGDRFDFIASWTDEKASETEWALFVDMLREELRSSRTIQELFTSGQTPIKYSIVRRQLSFR